MICCVRRFVGARLVSSADVSLAFLFLHFLRACCLAFLLHQCAFMFVVLDLAELPGCKCFPGSCAAVSWLGVVWDLGLGRSQLVMRAPAEVFFCNARIDTKRVCQPKNHNTMHNDHGQAVTHCKSEAQAMYKSMN